MTEQELKHEIASMWGELRAAGDMVIDAPSRKIGMPFAAPYEGVCFHVEEDGALVHVAIPADQVLRFAAALVAMLPLAIALDDAADADFAAHEAICKAKGV